MEPEITFGGHVHILEPKTIPITTADGIESTNAGNIMISTRRLPLLQPHPRKVGGLFYTQSFSPIFISVLFLS